MNKIKVYAVVTPEYVTYPSTAIEQEEYGRDYLEIEAFSKREAISIAVKEWLNEKRSYCKDQRQDNACPFTGVRAEEIVCPHGVSMPAGFDGDIWCAVCKKEIESENY
jgi:hypothetical protein